MKQKKKKAVRLAHLGPTLSSFLKKYFILNVLQVCYSQLPIVEREMMEIQLKRYLVFFFKSTVVCFYFGQNTLYLTLPWSFAFCTQPASSQRVYVLSQNQSIQRKTWLKPCSAASHTHTHKGISSPRPKGQHEVNYENVRDYCIFNYTHRPSH